ncbi:MAG: sugar transferase [Victivallales bacterium]|nr:sugar transferase [Victivallales bacterium]
MTTMAILPFVRADGRIDRAALHSRHGVRWLIWDFLVGMLAFWLGYVLSPHEQLANKLPATYYMVLVGGFYGFILSLCSRCSGVPRPEHTWSKYELVATALLGVVIAYVLFSAAASLLYFRQYGRYIAAGVMGISFAAMILPRLAVRALLPFSPLRIGLYGCVPACHEIDVLGHHPFLDVVGWFRPRHAQVGRSQMADLPLLGDIDDLDAQGKDRFGLDAVVFCMGDQLTHEDGVALMKLPASGIEVFTLGAFLERFHRKVSVEGCSANWFASGTAFMPNTSVFCVKRAMDIVLSLIGLALTLPLWPFIALAIKMSSPGPVFFRQERVGYLGQIFEIVKFRTMRTDAEKDGAQFAVENDPRATRVGNFLRKSRLDELPQLFNILRGSMSLVGPRPERPEFVATLGEEIPMYDLRHTVPPGLTGWAQIRYRYGANKEDAQRKLEYDLYYLRHFSLALELEIIVKTLPMMMRGSR